MKENILDWHIWDLKKATAQFLVPRLIEFKKWVEEGRMQSLPVWIKNGDIESEIDEAQLTKRWVDLIQEMIVGFTYYAGEGSNEDVDYVEVQKRKARALELFCMYYNHLWD